MQVVIRTDASVQIGWGHAMRCLALADELRESGASVHFVCRDFPGNVGIPIKAHGHELTLLPAPAQQYCPEKADPAHADWLGVSWQQDAQETLAALQGRCPHWLIVDHYAIDDRWHRKLRSHCSQVMVIDDLADRELDCELLLDQTYCRKEASYQSRVPDHCRFCLGSDYALLRPEFSRLRPVALERRRNFQGIKRILLFMGSTDPGNLTAAVLEALSAEKSLEKQTIDVVLGGSAPTLSRVRQRAANHRLQVNVLVDVEDMAKLMIKADLAIGSGGSSSWERGALGLPSLITVSADNQKVAADALHRHGAVFIWENMESLKRAVRALVESPENWSRMSQAAAEICDGLGCRRIRDELTRHVVH